MGHPVMRQELLKSHAFSETIISFETASQGPHRETFENFIKVVGVGKLRMITAAKIAIPNFSFSMFERVGPASVLVFTFEGSDDFFGTAEFDENHNVVGFHLDTSKVCMSATFSNSTIKIPGTSFAGQVSNMVVTPVDGQGA